MESGFFRVRLIVLVPRMTTFTSENQRGTFISTAQLYVGECDFLPAALHALLIDPGACLKFVSFNSLDVGLKFLSQSRRKVGRFCFRLNGFGTRVSIPSTTAFALKCVSL